MNGNITQLLDRLVEDGFRDNIRIICEFANLYLGTLKYQTYGKYPLIQMVVHGLNVTSFHSPLRKFFDICVPCSVEAMTGGMSVDEMEVHVCGIGDGEFLLELINNLCESSVRAAAVERWRRSVGM